MFRTDAFLLFVSELSWLSRIWPGQRPLITRQCWHPGCQGCASKNKTNETDRATNAGFINMFINVT